MSYYLKNYFKVNPKLGSRDRKILSDMAYSYYRASKGLDRDMEQGDKIKYSLYLSGINNKHIAPFLPELEMHANAADRTDALTKAGIAVNLNNIFPYEYELSDGIKKYSNFSLPIHSLLLLFQ